MGMLFLAFADLLRDEEDMTPEELFTHVSTGIDDVLEAAIEQEHPGRLLYMEAKRFFDRKIAFNIVIAFSEDAIAKGDRFLFPEDLIDLNRYVEVRISSTHKATAITSLGVSAQLSWEGRKEIIMIPWSFIVLVEKALKEPPPVKGRKMFDVHVNSSAEIPERTSEADLRIVK